MRQFTTKSQVYFGEGAVNALETSDFHRVLLVTDQFMLDSGMASHVLNILKRKNVQYSVFSEVVPDVPLQTVVRGIQWLKAFCPDMVIALGGGSSIDTAKAMIYMSMKSGSSRPNFVAIPTTSGTGSEVTSFAVLKDGDLKFPVADDVMIPDTAILDTNFVKSVPKQITADTGMDALSHGFEAYVSTRSSICTDAMAEKAIEMIFQNLPKVYQDGSLLHARENMSNAAYMAGVAFNNAGLGLNHSMAHTLGAKLHLSHGRANALVMPKVILFNGQHSEKARKKYSQIAHKLQIVPKYREESYVALSDAVKHLMHQLDIDLGELRDKISKVQYLELVPEMVQEAKSDMCTETTPYMPTNQAWHDLFVSVYDNN